MGKLEANKQQKLTSLLNTAFNLFTTQGVTKTSIAEISQKAGIAKGTFYLYFKDKYDIRNRLISHESSKLFKNAVADLEEFSKEKNEQLGFEEKIIFIINHIVDELNSNQTLLTFISKNLSWGIFKEALTTKVASDDINFKDVYYEMMPNNLVLGSLSGLVLVLVKIIPLPVSTITFVLNMILLVIGYIFIGREFGVKTVLASLMLPMYLRIFEILTPHVESLSGNIVIDLVCFMIVVGAGQAVLFNMNASSGGIDIVAKLINKYLGFKIGQSITIICVLISMAAIFVYDRETMVISLVGTLIYGQVLDRFCDGFHVRKKVSILSKEHEKIQNYIVRELRRGATIYPAYGGLDHAEHVEVVTILEKNEYGKLLSFIHETDEHAFVTVSTVNEVVGAWNTVKSR